MPEPAQSTRDGAETDPTEDLSQISMVELAERLDGITAQIERERVRVREARKTYEQIRNEAERRIDEIRQYAAKLVEEHNRRLRSFDGMLSAEHHQLREPIAELKPGTDIEIPSARPRTIEDAILKIWTLERYDQPLTTDEIAKALPEVGYESKAAARSLRSTVNQALARLAREGRIRKYRMDGTPLPEDQPEARARRYRPV